MSNNEIKNSKNVPLCRCRVLYIGSAVPTITKDGLQGIQQPLKERYPVNENTETKGIDSWLTVWSNGLLLEYIDGTKCTESAFFPIITLHYCAAVRYVNVSGFSIEGGGERFLPLDTPFAHIPDSSHPPIFAAIFRRTTGIKVLECHAFICTNENSANALVRCCFHSYGDTIYFKMDEKIFNNFPVKTFKELNRSITPTSEINSSEHDSNLIKKKNGLNDWHEEFDSNEKIVEQKTWSERQQNGEYDTFSIVSNFLKKPIKKNKKFGAKSKNNASELEGTVILYGDRQYDKKFENYTNNNYETNLNINDYTLYSNNNQNVPLSFLPNSQPLPIFSPFSSLSNVAINNINNYTRDKTPLSQPFFGLNSSFLKSSQPFFSFCPYFQQNFGFSPFLMEKPNSYLPVLPPRCIFMMPSSFNPNFHPQPMMKQNFKSTINALITGSRPIITESVYETFSRNKNTNEELMYMSSFNEDFKTNVTSSYLNNKPDVFVPKHNEILNKNCEKQKKNLSQKVGSDSDSTETSLNAKQNDKKFWKTYETNIYRKSNISEKAFAQTLNTTESEKNLQKFKTRENNLVRPNTPPADYDEEIFNQNKESNKKN